MKTKAVLASIVLLFSCSFVNAGVPWCPEGAKYSVVFCGQPKVKAVETEWGGKRIPAMEAEYIGKNGYYRAEIATLETIQPVSREAAMTYLSNCAVTFGMQSSSREFDDADPNDHVATLKGTKVMEREGKKVTISVLSETHWCRGGLIAILILGEPPTFPSDDDIAFLKSVRLVGATASKPTQEVADQGAEAHKQGLRYMKGEGVPRNYEEAAKWFTISAEQGNAWGQFDLGICYRDGKGVPKNDEEAYFWLILAESKIKMRASPAIETRLKPEQVAAGQRRAASFAPKQQASSSN